MLKPKAVELEKLEKPFDFKQFKKMIAYLKPHIKSLVLIILMMFICVYCVQLVPKLIQIAIDDILEPTSVDAGGNLSSITLTIQNMVGTDSIKVLAVLAGGMTALLLLNSFLIVIRNRMLVKTGQKILFNMRNDLFKHVQKLSLRYFDTRPDGKIFVRIINDVNDIGNLLTNGLIGLCVNVFSLIVIIAMMLSLNVQLTLISLAVIPLLLIAMISIKRIIRGRWQKVRVVRSGLNAFITETLNGMRVTQAFTLEDETNEIFKEQTESFNTTMYRAAKASILTWPLIKIVSALGILLIYIFGIRYIDQGVVTVGVLIAFISYVNRFWAPILGFAEFYNQILKAMASGERIFETLDEKEDITDEPDAIDLPNIKGEVRFENVEFYYEEDKPVLSDVNFVVKPGQRVALVGPTGAGKTTVVNLLSRFYDVIGGSIKVDGVDIRDVKINSLRSQMGVMMQDSFIFSGTIIENIRYGNPDASKEAVIEAAKAVNIHDFIMSTERGYDTVVNERGAGLSQGQRQLISFARALLADPAILILDEATASIDTETERMVQAGLDRLLKNRTSFVIAHRLSTIQNSDQIYVIDKGIVAESGTHDELIKTGGHYYELHESQYKYLEEAV